MQMQEGGIDRYEVSTFGDGEAFRLDANLYRNWLNYNTRLHIVRRRFRSLLPQRDTKLDCSPISPAGHVVTGLFEVAIEAAGVLSHRLATARKKMEGCLVCASCGLKS
jgi:hypothetical protein